MSILKYLFWKGFFCKLAIFFCKALCVLNWLTWAYLAWKRFLDEDLCVWKVCSVSADDLLPPTAPPALEWSALRNWMPNSYRKFSKVRCPQKYSRTSSTTFAPIEHFSCLSKNIVFLDENLQKWPLWAIRNSQKWIECRRSISTVFCLLWFMAF